jgi:ketosteroid isomerase-like protein
VTLEHLGSIGDLVGGLAVVATLVYLAIQTRQNTIALRAATVNRTTHSIADALEHLSGETDLAGIVTRGHAAPAYRDESLRPEEWNRYAWLQSGFGYRIEDYFLQFQRGTLDPAIWRRYAQFWRNNPELPAARGCWNSEVAAGAYSPDYVAAIEALPPTGGGEIRRQRASGDRASSAAAAASSPRPPAARHPYIDTVARYFNGANAGDPAQMLPCFADDIEVYSTGTPPRRGAQAVAQYFVDFHHTGARWTIDHCVVEAPEAVVEWTMVLTAPGESHESLHRGIDWFVFQDDGRIRQIREFVHTDAPLPGRTLDQFPYAERGYPTLSDFDARLPN